ncbi:MAG: hypothetical protein JSR41_22990 [Proteobacteria bacterium]|nr:hypothetical protein [Pseudomonadota bacterium]
MPSVLGLLIIFLVPAYALIGTLVVMLVVFHSRVVTGGRWWPCKIGWGMRMVVASLILLDLLFSVIAVLTWLE